MATLSDRSIRTKLRKQAGLCHNCNAKRLPNESHCAACKQATRDRHRRTHKERRILVISHYGNCCAQCLESTYEFLTIEHKDGGGREHKRSIGAANVAKWIIENNYPNNFEILCWNCNCSKNVKSTHSSSINAVIKRRYNLKLRTEAINAYGGKCDCCGLSEIKKLTIDHVDGGGCRHRKSLTTSGISFYNWLRRNNYPTGFRVLCFNCNCSIGTYGHCPHIMAQMH